MATDYDEPRVRPEDQPANESLEAIQAQRSATTQTALIDVEDGETAEGIDLPGADLSHEELLIQVIPQRGGRIHLHVLLPGAPPRPARP